MKAGKEATGSQDASGRLLAAISSRPGQCGRADEYEFSSH